MKKETLLKRTPEHQKYVCVPCGYVYDPEKGDPKDGVAPGTPFDDLPYDWVCPVCGAPKDDFVKIQKYRR
ncbi:MAG TPA: rubredoxin [bacterium]|nr:rubredoxin [bacterium]